jgi:16S rRNA (guanine(966)-N(2))-methyltransferase RsmD
MALRIIAGSAHGRRLRVPGGPTRPTSSLVRGALFNMLEHRGWLANASLIDLYAGSGALGIEALSRGARAVVFVETSASVLRTLRDNLAASGYRGRAEVIATSAERALRTLERQGRRVDGVIADPPYGRGFVQRVVDQLAAGTVLGPGGWVAVEHAVDEAPEERPGLVAVARRRHGGTALTLLCRPEGPT